MMAISRCGTRAPSTTCGLIRGSATIRSCRSSPWRSPMSCRVRNCSERLNEINTKLRFARIFWVKNQVLIESEMPGMALSFEGIENACSTVGGAAHFFGPRLAEEFGGRTAFEDEKQSGYETPENWPGQYL